MGLIVFLLFVVGCFVVYPLPTMIAARRSHPRSLAIFKLNLLVGWTIVGWLIALVWSCLPTEGDSSQGAGPPECRPQTEEAVAQSGTPGVTF